MSEENKQLAVRAPMPYDQMEKLAIAAAGSGMFGITKKEQALCLFAICQSEGLDPIAALRRYHIIEGKPSMRADAMAADFIIHGGAILWHIRTDGIAAATFFSEKGKLTEASRARAVQRFDLLWKYDSEEDPVQIATLMSEISKLSWEGEETIVRTYSDAVDKGLTTSWKKDDQGVYKQKTKVNWEQSPRQMLTARVITEGVRLVSPGLIAGVYSPEEVQDIVHAEEEEREEFVQRALTAPVPRDRKAIEAMIDRYVEDAATASPTEKSRLLGLASELRCKLADMDEIPGIAPAGLEPKKSREEVLPSKADPELNLRNEPAQTVIPWEDYKLQHVSSKTLRGKRLGDFSASEIAVIYGKTSHALKNEDPKIRIEAEYIQQAHDAHLDAKKKEETP